MKKFTLVLFSLFTTIYLLPVAGYANVFSLDFDTQEIAKKKPSLSANDIQLSSPQTNKAWRLGLEALFHPEFLKGRGEIKYSNNLEGDGAEFFESDNYLISLEFTGKKDAFSYGLSHYSLGKKYSGLFNSQDSKVKDRASNNIWLSYQFNELILKTKYTQLWTNLNGSSEKGFLEDNYSIESIYKLSDFPYSSFSIAYVIGNKHHYNNLNPLLSYKDKLSSVKSKFELKHHFVRFLIDAVYLTSNIDRESRGGLQENKIKVTSTFFPESELSIIPSFRFINKKQLIFAQQTESNDTEPSLGLKYKPEYSQYEWKVTTAFYQNNNIHQFDKDTFKLGTRLDWNKKIHSIGTTAKWGIGYQFKEYSYDSNQNAGYTDWNVKLNFSLSLS